MDNLENLEDLEDLKAFLGMEDLTEPEAPEAPENPEAPETSEPPKNEKKRVRPKTGKQDRPIIVMLTVVLVLLITLIVAVLGIKYYVLVGGHLYSRNAPALDLRERTLSVAEYRAIREKLPNCRILWNVPFQGGTVPSDTAELTVTTLSDEDLAALAYLPELTTLNGKNCRDYAQLSAFRESRPDCQVLFRVEINGKSYNQDTERVSVTSLTEAEGELLSFLPNLRILDGEKCAAYGLLARLQESHPDWDVRYTVHMGDGALRKDTREAEVTGADSGELIAGMAGLPELQSLTLVDPRADGATLLALRQQYPDVKLRWYFDVGGRLLDETAVEVDVSGRDFSSLEEAENMASCFPKLEKFVMSSCTINGTAIDNDTMADFRERMRSEYKVVWTVQCGTIAVRTDATTFMPTREGEFYFQDEMARNLRYCEDMICVDIGHHRVKDISFVRNMPHLKYLILTETAVQDISPLADLKELVFLELTFGIVRDYSPLLGCTALEDLNMDKLYYYADPSPIYQMTWLKTLFWHKCNGSVIVKLQEALPDTTLDFTGTTTNTAGTGWRNLQNYYDMRDILGMDYMR